MKETTKEFASFLSRIQFDQLPAVVVKQAKKCILDFIGVAIAGTGAPAYQEITGLSKIFGGPPESSVVKADFKTSAPVATLINGTVAHGLELDDGHILAHAHPGVTTIPAALSVGEKMHCSGKDLIAAVVTGYEPVVRIGDAITPSALYDRGIHTAALVGTFGAAMAVSKLLCFNLDQTLNAFGNCCLTPVSPFETFKEGANVKDFYGGWPAFVGTMAALMAKEGFGGSKRLLEGRLGFCKNISDDYDLDRITRSMGEQWEIMGVYFKKHASCSLSHTTMDAVIALLESHPVRPEEINKIVVKTHRFASDLSETGPDTATAAKSSIPFCVALAVSKGRVSLEEFTTGNIEDNEIRALSQKVEVQLDKELDDLHLSREDLRPSVVEINTKDGRFFTERRDIAKGWPADPLSDEELEEKFITLTRNILAEKQASKIIETIYAFDTVEDISGFVEEAYRP